MASSNLLANVAIVGAGGNSGSFMTAELLKTGKHTVTAITRADSQSKLPDGVIVKKVDYKKPQTLVEALRGQHVLVITLNVQAQNDAQMILIKAAGEAGVPWILPNEWGIDSSNDELVRDVVAIKACPIASQAIADLGKSSYIRVSTGFWYEWSLSVPIRFGIDIANRSATLFDDGETKMSVSTWPQVGRAVAALLSLPIKAESGNPACLEDFKNKHVYINSFTVSQKDMLESAYRTTGTTKADWTITNEPAQERYTNGIKAMNEGDIVGFVKSMYTRVFFPDGVGDYEHKKGTINNVLGLPKEDIDEATKRTIEYGNSSRS